MSTRQSSFAYGEAKSMNYVLPEGRSTGFADQATIQWPHLLCQRYSAYMLRCAAFIR